MDIAGYRGVVVEIVKGRERVEADPVQPGGQDAAFVGFPLPVAEVAEPPGAPGFGVRVAARHDTLLDVL